MEQRTLTQRTFTQWGEWLLASGYLRQLDTQLARMLARHGADESLVLLVAIVSSQVGKGHICLSLSPNGNGPAWAQRLGLFGENAILFSQAIDEHDWHSVLTHSPLVSSGDSRDCPLVYETGRVYLQRYWWYELQLASHLDHLASTVALDRTQQQRLRQSLDHLFRRQYQFLYTALNKAREEGSDSAVVRQMLTCDHLDIVEEQGLDWAAIDRLLTGARSIADLSGLDALIPERHCLNWQKVAAAAALTRRFTVISGGPGTGKTTTVAKLLAALVEQATADGESPSIKLVAPTGKAAARLTESIGGAIQKLPIAPEMKALIPTEASTLHRLLGAIPNSVEFRHHKHNPLHLDILVVDEASMVDLPMMYRLCLALPSHARLILLGDRDQLSSVEAGAVLGDVFSFYEQGYSDSQSETLASLTGYSALKQSRQKGTSLADCLCMLQKSYRFDARSGIGQLAKAINSGEVSRVNQVWQKGFADIEHYPLSASHYTQMLGQLTDEYAQYLKAIDSDGLGDDAQVQAQSILNLFAQCRLLCAVREGDFGVVGLNERIERTLNQRGLISKGEELWYSGRPVMVSRNDPSSGLFNGDIGLCLPVIEDGQRKLKVFFEMPDGSVKAILPSRVPEHETAFAMTIHKSQGSEFDFTAMILPPDFSPILTRELIYTGITRAKSRLALYADAAVVNRAVQTRTERTSGLTDRLA
ncbi:exodeoxyribonuclease V subunit alpha [Vibrio sp. WXL103]|uniref:exodeoxyribonuclease V subunit alpha n=1 Tax=Vibrio sp. WXL103 TaxID=3450710 RepID=UPI003EC634EF